MNELDFLRAQVAREQERLLGILAESVAALAASGMPPRAAATHALATGAYLRFAGRRALARDRAHAQRLETRTLPGDAATIEALAALRAGFAERERSLQALDDALERQAAGAPSAEEILAHAIRAASRAHDGLPRRWHALEPALLHHYVIEDWRATTRIDADGILEERALHAAVAGLASA